MTAEESSNMEKLEKLFYEEIHPQIDRLLRGLTIEKVEKVDDLSQKIEMLHTCICAIANVLNSFIYVQEKAGLAPEYRAHICEKLLKKDYN